MNKNIIAVVLLLVGLGAGFFGGMQYQKSQRPSFNGAGGFRTRGQGGTNTQALRGTIDSVDSGSITLKLQDGSSKIVLISSQTNIAKNASASASDLKSGDTVTAFGNQNSDGSISASNIQIGGNLPGMPRGGAGATGG